MYSPRIKPDQVKRLYQLKQLKFNRTPMTHLVREAIEEYLTKNENKLEEKK